MIRSLFFKQKKPQTIVVLGIVMLLLGLFMSFDDMGTLSQSFALMFISMVLLGYSISFEIRQDFKNCKHYRLLGFTIFKSKLKISFPEYLIVFSARHKQGTEWGSVAALGKQRSGDDFVIRFFKGVSHFTLFRTNSYQLAKDRAMELSEFLGVEIKGKI